LRSKNSNKKSGSQSQGKLSFYFRRVILFSLTGILTGVIVMTAYHVAKAFYVRDIQVSGCNRLDRSDIEGILNVKGEPLLNLHLRDIETKLRRSAWIKKASLRWLLPGTLVIHIEEAAPKALLSYGGEMFLVNEEGNIMEKLDEQATPFLPVIRDIDPRYKKVMSEAMRLVDALTAKNIIAERQYVEIGLEPFGFTTNIDGEFIKVGYGQYGEKFDRWADLEPELKKRGVPIQYVDLRFKDSVIVKPVKEEKEKQEKQGKQKSADVKKGANKNSSVNKKEKKIS
jgi:cell division septal protein FtsQ